jgi:hypothetical protein
LVAAAAGVSKSETYSTQLHAHMQMTPTHTTHTPLTQSNTCIVHLFLLLQPEFWLKTGLGGWTEEGNWVPGFEGYAPYFHRVASALNPCDDPEGPQLSGPGWGESLHDLAF